MRLLKFFQTNKPEYPSVLKKEVIEEAAYRYKINPGRLNLIHVSGSCVFEADNAILRLSHFTHQSYEAINAKVHWQEYLHNNKAQVAKILPSAFGNFAERIPTEDGYFTAVLFEKVKGTKITNKEWNNEMFLKIGKLTGRLHALTKLYSSDPLITRRQTWHVTEPNQVKKSIPASEYHLIEKFENCLKEVNKLTTTTENFGLIHNDIYRGNMLLHDGQITLFDFEDCCYSWFVNDIACTAYHALLNNKKPLPESFEYLHNFMNNFWKGYKTNNTINKDEIKYIPYLIGARAISIYAHLNRASNFKNWNASQVSFFNFNKNYADHDYTAIDYKLFK